MEEDLNQNQEPAELRPDDELRSVLNDINDAISKKDKTLESSCYERAQNIFEKITGENLIEKAEKEARAEAEAEGSRSISLKDVFTEENLNYEIEKFKVKQRDFDMQRTWGFLSEEEKKKYDNDINLFFTEMENKLEKFGVLTGPVSREIFYNMMACGYMFSDLKKSIFDGRIKIPVFLGAGVYKFKAMSQRDFENWMAVLQNSFDLISRQAVENTLNKKIIKAKRGWQKRKSRKIKELLYRAIDKIETEKRMEEKIRQKVQEQMELQQKKFEQEHSGIKEAEAIKKFKKFEDEEKKADKELKRELVKMEKRIDKDLKGADEDKKEADKLEKIHEKKEKISAQKDVFSKILEKNKGAEKTN